MDIKKFENTLIAFDFESEFVNATDMLKAYNELHGTDKRLENYLRIKSTKDYITALKSDTQISAPDYQSIRQVKNQFGKSEITWIHKMLAYDFAAWLSPEFRLFVYKAFDSYICDKLKSQQRQLDYFWDKEDVKDLYKR